MSKKDIAEVENVWETKIPLVLLAIGVLTVTFGEFVAGGAGNIGRIFTELLVYLLLLVPLTIAAMYIVASLIGVSFGILQTAILKLAAITMFTLAIDLIGGWTDHTFIAWVVSVGVSLYLFSKFFDLAFRETLLSVVLISIIRFLLLILVAAALSAVVAAV